MRRSRFDNTVTDLRVVIQERDLDFFYALFVHQNLSTPMLKAVAAPDLNYKVFINRLRKLHHAGYLRVPNEQKYATAKDPNRVSLVWQLTGHAIQVLADRDDRVADEAVQWHAGITSTRIQHAHEAMNDYLTASIELGCAAENLTFVNWVDILDRDECPTKTKNAANPLRIEFEVDGKPQHVVPDALFGIQHSGGVNFFVLETDRKNEPVTTSDIRRASMGKHLNNYRRILRQQLYRTHFGIENLQVVVVTTSTAHMRTSLEFLEKETKVKDPELSGPRPFLFKALPEFARHSSIDPPISGHVLTSPWQRVGEKQASLIK